MDKEDITVHPFQGHVRKNIEKRGTAQLLVPAGAYLITARDRDTVYECVVVVAQHGHERKSRARSRMISRHVSGHCRGAGYRQG